MSASLELQGLIIQRLKLDDDLKAVVAGRVYDIPPPSRVFPYVSIGPSDAVEDDEECIVGRVETIQIDCWSRHAGGFMEVKQVADAVKKSLHHHEGQMIMNALVEMRVVAIRYFRDPDGLTSHGVVTVSAMIEESN